MRNKLPFMLLLACMGAATAAQAADRGAVLTAYSRSEVSILRKGLKVDPSLMPWQEHKALEERKLVFEVEVREGKSIYGQEGWFNLSGYDDNKGLLLTFPAPVQTPILPASQYVPVDILFIDKEGVVTQIAPKVILAELEDPIMPQAPIMAFLFLKSGMCEKLVINPGDIVDFSIFKPSPVILGVQQRQGGGEDKKAAPMIITPPAKAPEAPQPLPPTEGEPTVR